MAYRGFRYTFTTMEVDRETNLAHVITEKTPEETDPRIDDLLDLSRELDGKEPFLDMVAKVLK